MSSLINYCFGALGFGMVSTSTVYMFREETMKNHIRNLESDRRYAELARAQDSFKRWNEASILYQLFNNPKD